MRRAAVTAVGLTASLASLGAFALALLSACEGEVLIGKDTPDAATPDSFDAEPPCRGPDCGHVEPLLHWYRSCPERACVESDAGPPIPPPPPPDCPPDGTLCLQRGQRCGLPFKGPPSDCTTLVCEPVDPRQRGCF